jgi:hypothetical protein
MLRKGAEGEAVAMDSLSSRDASLDDFASNLFWDAAKQAWGDPRLG